jgi:hypothetical protein
VVIQDDGFFLSLLLFTHKFDLYFISSQRAHSQKMMLRRIRTTDREAPTVFHVIIISVVLLLIMLSLSPRYTDEQVQDAKNQALIDAWNRIRLNDLWRAQGLASDDIEGGIHPPQALQILKILNTARVQGRPIQTVCETGFFRGGSSLFWLMAIPGSRVHSFDQKAHANAVEWFTYNYPNRWFYHEGDSTSTVPQFHADNPGVICDLVLVDGWHQEIVPYLDLFNFKAMSHANTIIIMDDAFDEHDPNFDTPPLTCSKSWKKGLDEELIRALPEEKYGPSCTPFGRTPNRDWPIGQCTGEYIM